MPRRIAVLGGGVAGVVAARELARDGICEVELFEGRSRLGGLQRSVVAGGLVFDVGAFVFDPEHALFTSFPTLRDLFPTVDHHSLAITPSGTLDRFPLSPRGYLRDHGMGGALLAGGSLLAGKIRHRRRDSLPSYLRYYLGERLYRESGLQSYIQRFFSADDSQVDLAFARQRLGSIAEECSIRGNALRIVRELLASSASPPPWNCHVRPPGGFDVVYGEIASVLDRSGVVIRTGSPIGAISRCNGGFVITTADDEHHVDRIVSSVPLGAIACALSIPIRREPEFVTLFSLYYRFTGDPGYAAPYLYNFTHDGVWKRITLFSSYYGTAAGDHYFVVECTGRSGAEERLEILAGEFQRQMGSLPFFDGALTYVGGSVTPNAYPMSRRDGGRDLEDLRRAVLAAGIEVVGRQGRFEHTSSHAVATDSRAVATRVMQEGGNAA